MNYKNYGNYKNYMNYKNYGNYKNYMNYRNYKKYIIPIKILRNCNKQINIEFKLLHYYLQILNDP